MAVKNTKAKGARNERRSMEILEGVGYACTRSGASLGVFDIVGISRKGIVLCQVKHRDWPGAAEMERIRLFQAPDNAVKIIHRYREGIVVPDSRVVD